MRVENFEVKEYIRREQILTSKGITYKEFLKSRRWQIAKERLFMRDGKLCKICGSSEKINVHHNNYNEANLSGSIRCLVVLCNTCHEEVHRIAKINGWYYKRIVRVMKRRFKKHGDRIIYHKRVVDKSLTKLK